MFLADPKQGTTMPVMVPQTSLVHQAAAVSKQSSKVSNANMASFLLPASSASNTTNKKLMEKLKKQPSRPVKELLELYEKRRIEFEKF